MTTRLVSCSVSLPEALARTLITAGQQDLSRFAVLLPTQRLQNYVRLALATELTGCIPPQMYSLSEFVSRLPVADGRRKITVEEQRLILNALLLEREYRFLRPGMESDLARFFREIVESDLREQVFPRLQELLLQDAYRSDEHLQQLQQHVEEWADLYESYMEFLDKFELTDEALDFADRVRAATASEPSALFNFFDQLIVAGFSDANPVQMRLFQTLARLPNVMFWVHADPVAVEAATAETTPTHPYAVLHRFLKMLNIDRFEDHVEAPMPAQAPVIRSAFGLPTGENAVASTPEVHVHRALTLIDEVKGAAALVRDLVLKHQIAPEKIVVAVPDEAQYARLVWTVFETADIPINFAVGIPFDETQVGQWIRLFLELARHDYRNQDMLSLFSIPICKHWMSIAGIAAEPAQLQDRLQRLIVNFDIAAGFAAYHDAVRETPDGDPELSRFLELLQTTLAPLASDDTKTYQEWGEALWRFSESLRLLEIFAWNSDDPYNLNMRALRQWYGFIKSLIRTGDILQENLPLHELYALLMQNIFRKKVRPAGEPFVGVQIVGLMETRSIPAEAVIVLGNVEGSLPKLTERELFISEAFRRRLSLPTLQHQEQLQDQWFYQLMAATPRVHLFWHEYVDESPRVKSRYLQRLELGAKMLSVGLPESVVHGRALPGDFLHPDWEKEWPDDLRKEYQILRQRIAGRRDERGRYSGDRRNVLVQLSAHSLKDLLHCPYRFLLSRLGVEHETLPESDADSRQFGQWLHQVLFYFFRGLDDPSLAGADPDLYQPWTEAIDSLNHEQALDRLRRLSEVLRGKLRGKLESYFQVMHSIWPWLVKKERERDPWDFDPLDFERELEVQWQGDGLEEEPAVMPVRFRMRIDRLVRSGSQINIVDYKTRLPDVSKRAFREGLDPQLPLYYYGLIQQGAHGEFVGEYVGLLDRDCERYGKSSRKDSNAPLNEAWPEVAKRLNRRLTELLVEHRPFEPLDGALCKYCDFVDICRRNEVDYAVQRLDEATPSESDG